MTLVEAFTLDRAPTAVRGRFEDIDLDQDILVLERRLEDRLWWGHANQLGGAGECEGHIVRSGLDHDPLGDQECYFGADVMPELKPGERAGVEVIPVQWVSSWK